MSKYGQTPSQTVGPFFHFALPYEGGDVLVRDETQGERITLEGRVIDGDGLPVPDALVEIWQANAAGRYAHPEDKQDRALDPAFNGFGRCPTKPDGFFRFLTVKPGPVPGPGNTLQAPHIAVSVFARGMLKRLVTRVYFEDEAEANAIDPVLGLIEDEARRATLIARRAPGKTGVYALDIVLQGDNETVFFDA